MTKTKTSERDTTMDYEKILEKCKNEKRKTDMNYNTTIKDNPEAQRYARGYVAGISFVESFVIKLKNREGK